YLEDAVFLGNRLNLPLANSNGELCVFDGLIGGEAVEEDGESVLAGQHAHQLIIRRNRYHAWRDRQVQRRGLVVVMTLVRKSDGRKQELHSSKNCGRKHGMHSGGPRAAHTSDGSRPIVVRHDRPKSMSQRQVSSRATAGSREWSELGQGNRWSQEAIRRGALHRLYPQN